MILESFDIPLRKQQHTSYLSYDDATLRESSEFFLFFLVLF